MESIDINLCRRLALTRAGLLKPEWTGMPRRAVGMTRRARNAAHKIIRRFGYLQLDTVSISGARSHAIVLMSRLDGFRPGLAEKLLQPGEPLFEYWGHEASWIPIEHYPLFAFRRRAFRHHPWWGDLTGQNPKIADSLIRKIRDEGPLRSLDMEGQGSRGWWDLKLVKKVATTLWSSGVLAIRERHRFQRVYDLAERVIPEEWRRCQVSKEDALKQLLIVALQGHGWATTGTLSQTWRLQNLRKQVLSALTRLEEEKRVEKCRLCDDIGRSVEGWIRPNDLNLAYRLKRIRPAKDKGVLLSPFDPLLWDRKRVRQLFGFQQVLEIFKPAAQRKYGYYCLPVLAGENLVARVDLKADRKIRTLRVLSCMFEGNTKTKNIPSIDRKATRFALDRYADALDYRIEGLPTSLK